MFLIGGAVFLTLFVFIVIYAAIKTPSFPDEWRSVHTGMSKKEVLAVVSEKFVNVDPKIPVEIATRSYDIPGIKKGRWQLYIEYDKNIQVKKVLVGYFNANNKSAIPPWRPLHEF